MINYFGGVYMNGMHQVLSFSLLIVKQKEICWVSGTLLLEGRSSAKTTIEVIIEEITWYPRSFQDFMLQDSAFFNLSHQELPTYENKEASFYHLISQVKASKFEKKARHRLQKLLPIPYTKMNPMDEGILNQSSNRKIHNHSITAVIKLFWSKEI